ncbi:MAG TPA: cyclophilin-like fold protein [Methylomirabilota bacterium]|nr:cyclophilin-like fold protein [Methylomirabilota bacterium]
MADRAIVITAGRVSTEARLNDSKTAAAIWDALPIEAKADTWGDEIYFDIGLTAAPESPREVVEPGDLGYWPPGRAFCVFFGPTPMSRGDEIRPASPVNVVGRIVGDPKAFKAVRAGTRVTLRRNE